MRIGAHAARSIGGKFPEFRPQPTLLVKQLLRPVAAQPLLQHSQVRRLLVQLGQRHLMGAPEPLDLVPVDLLWAGPSFGAAQNYHRPSLLLHLTVCYERLLMNAPNFLL